MYYATSTQSANSRRVVWGFPTKAERDKAIGGTYPSDWRAASAAEAKAFAVNADRISLLGVTECPSWLRSALYRSWRLRRYSNGITLDRPELVAVYL